MAFIDPTASLVRLDPPKPLEQIKRPKALKVMKPSIAAAAASTRNGLPSHLTGGSGVPSDGSRAAPTAEDIVAAILPPREVLADDGTKLFQVVSLQPASRLDVIRLQETLDNRLVQRQAKEVGLCPIRSELYADTFDELIRQVTIDSPERGLLLLRIRDEARQNIMLHKALHQAGAAFGVRKQMSAEQGLAEMRETRRQLERQHRELEAQVQILLGRIDAVEKASQDERVITDKRHNDQAAFLRKTNQQLTASIKAETEKANNKK